MQRRMAASASQMKIGPAKMNFCSNCTVFGWVELDPNKLKKCTKCKVPQYCSKSCKREHWRLVHKQQCQEIAAVGKLGKLLDGSDPLQDLATQADKTQAKAEDGQGVHVQVVFHQGVQSAESASARGKTVGAGGFVSQDCLPKALASTSMLMWISSLRSLRLITNTPIFSTSS